MFQISQVHVSDITFSISFRISEKLFKFVILLHLTLDVGEFVSSCWLKMKQNSRMVLLILFYFDCFSHGLFLFSLSCYLLSYHLCCSPFSLLNQGNTRSHRKLHRNIIWHASALESDATVSGREPQPLEGISKYDMQFDRPGLAQYIQQLHHPTTARPQVESVPIAHAQFVIEQNILQRRVRSKNKVREPKSASNPWGWPQVHTSRLASKVATGRIMNLCFLPCLLRPNSDYNWLLITIGH